ncbi:hypothetical protein NDU88_010076 [Pleurodeles waltl]|uniref:Uncharacterized protein n=1 Tax=Pleurodeles waltl TaxID=8319 RepID=A0AAV7S278_PLEWA|nr:hypothetical protein NDU88_010076 [Pleurodeles waltl]
MRAEALKRGKDWLRAKMDKKGEENQSQDLSAPACSTSTDGTSTVGSISPPPQKASKRQRTEGKLARKVAKKARGMDQTTGEHPTSAPVTSISRVPAESEHISAIIN